MKILMVLTSHDQLGSAEVKTGFWLEEFAAPYYVFLDSGVDVTLASPKGGQPQIDPSGDLPENQTSAMARFKQDPHTRELLAHTLELSDMRSQDFDAVFYPGGHGPMWDRTGNADSIALIESFYSFYNSGKPVAAVCHAPAVLHRVMYRGAPIVKGKWEFYEEAPDGESFTNVDSRLIAGQNPASSTAGAKALLELLAMSKAA